MTAAIRRIDLADETALLAYARIRNNVTPDNTDSLEQLRWETAAYPGEAVRFLAEEDGIAVGTACTGRIWMHERGFERWWLGSGWNRKRGAAEPGLPSTRL